MRLLFCILLVGLTVTGASGPPNPYIDKGACPFEGCTYREWVAKRDLTLFDLPNGQRRIGRLGAGERVTALTGEVRSVPKLVHAKANVQNPDKPEETIIPKGEAFYLLHHIGEGNWLSWYRGKLVPVESFLVAGSFPKSVWWAKVKTRTGLVGWVVSDGNFDGQDRLA
jgi:hypothetical protein